jgi:hypothetical protein
MLGTMYISCSVRYTLSISCFKYSHASQLALNNPALIYICWCNHRKLILQALRPGL